MSVVNPDHLLEQADKLILPPTSGPPRQVDVRRAISAAYYAVFHSILIAAADEYVGVTKRSISRYAIVYRSIDHRNLRDLCIEVGKQTLTAKYRRYAPTNGFGPNIRAFAGACLELQEKRHSADYDPATRVNTSDARLAIATARSAIRRFGLASPARKKTFLALLAFPPR